MFHPLALLGLGIGAVALISRANAGTSQGSGPASPQARRAKVVRAAERYISRHSLPGVQMRVETATPEKALISVLPPVGPRTYLVLTQVAGEADRVAGFASRRAALHAVHGA